ncbi:predicted protein [Lichtheimia corymbifera JMRC:FSU:9682]|uniref:Uncharacterized protein n=1 Tax=Lichtheimia corymbifera JMRC:FSU:9682 TaxID=1263082 RepID=A0A068SCZ8_9FUNG|nr:predicted protein [Lichtheimia corymbifera JMRC:FSU:9682]
MKRGIFNRTKLRRRGEAHLGCKFHDRRGRSQIHPMSPPAKLDRGVDLLNFFKLLATLRKLGLATTIVKLPQYMLSTQLSNFVL